VLIRNAEIAGRRLDVRCENGRIRALGPGLAPRAGEACLEANGGALLPGLHDHHLHFFAFAAALESVPCGPPQVGSAEALARSLRTAPVRDGWIRGTGYFESVAGPLDRARLDALAPATPLRIQHRSGVMWFLNSAAIAVLGLDEPAARRGEASLPDVERDAAGRATGRLFRADAWLRERLPRSGPPDLARAARELARFGVTGFTDATPTNDRAQVEVFREAQRSGRLPQRVRLMGDASLAALASDEQLAIDARKFLLDEPALPPFDTLVADIAEAHAAGRGCAFHCVTRVEIHFALAALEAAGPSLRDRLEHASVAPPEAIAQARRLGVRVVTQPNFACERGDDYHRDVAPGDQGDLYRLRSWLEAEVILAAGTDAPYGDADPWRAMRAAVERTTWTGVAIGPDERLSPEQALALFASDRLDTGAGSRALAANGPGAGLVIGGCADLCLLDAPWQAVRESLSSDRVAAVVCGGRLVHARAE
jgi:predicted amidohydrolase YtcJ